MKLISHELLPVLIPAALALLFCSCAEDADSPVEVSFEDTSPAYLYTYRVIDVFPHDREAFTQGLAYYGGFLYEGTGIFKRSTLRRVELETGEIRKIIQLDDRYWGEGVTVYGDSIVQLTWNSNIGFVYGRESSERIGTFGYPTQGWGLKHDGVRMIMSDGTDALRFLDPVTFEEVGSVAVRDSSGPVDMLNELEYVRGEVFANVWKTDCIVRIEPETGRVAGRIDLEGLLQPGDLTEPVDVLNGIACDEENGRLFVTGKLWPKLFEIELVPAE